MIIQHYDVWRLTMDLIITNKDLYNLNKKLYNLSSKEALKIKDDIQKIMDDYKELEDIARAIKNKLYSLEEEGKSKYDESMESLRKLSAYVKFPPEDVKNDHITFNQHIYDSIHSIINLLAVDKANYKIGARVVVDVIKM